MLQSLKAQWKRGADTLSRRPINNKGLEIS